MRRTVVEVYSTQEEWRCEFADRAERARFVAWCRAAGRLGPPIGDLADERREEIVFVASLKEWLASNGREWVDEPQNEERVDTTLAQRTAGLREGANEARRRSVVQTWRWKGHRLRRQRLGEGEVVYVANTIAKWISGRESAKEARAPDPALDSVPDEARDLGADILACLREDRWRPHTYNEIAKAVGTDWKSALHAVRRLVGEGSGVVTVGEGKDIRFRFTPEARGWKRSGKEEGRVRQVATLALAAIEHHVGVGKRRLRDLVRETLGTCASATIDAALRALVGSGLVMAQEGGAGMASRYFVVCFEEDDLQAKAIAESFLSDECAYEERALRSARHGISRNDSGLKEQARRDAA